MAFRRARAETARVSGPAERVDLIEEVERLVCGFYGRTDEITDAVVAHAVARAESASVPGE
jgi:hypothetical protein